MISRAGVRRPPPQLPGRYKKTSAKKNTSLIASAIDVAGSNNEPAVTNGIDGNKGDISIKGLQGQVGGNNKGNNSNDDDIGKSDGKVGNDNNGNGGINKDESAVTNKTDGSKGNSSIKGQQGEVGGDNKCGDSNDADIDKADGKVGNDNNGNGGINSNEVDDPDSEDASSASSGSEGFVVDAVNEPGQCAWMSAHHCICADQAASECKGNSTEQCLCKVHHDYLLFWECTQPVTMVCVQFIIHNSR